MQIAGGRVGLQGAQGVGRGRGQIEVGGAGPRGKGGGRRVQGSAGWRAWGAGRSRWRGQAGGSLPGAAGLRQGRPRRVR
ncbi:MAG: hypothetical protein R3C43_18425 [Chloroflexota bacterium]